MLNVIILPMLNNFTRSIPQSSGKNRKLQILDLLSNKLTSSAFSLLMCSDNKLEILITRGNFLFGPILESYRE